MLLRKFYLNGYPKELEFDVENHCPFCAYYNEPKRLLALYNSNEELRIATVFFKTHCCDNNFVSIYSIDKNDITKLIATYPTGSPEVFPQVIFDLSPDFIKLYTQSKTAEDNAHFELASTGYRNAIEFLIKDFAIKFLAKSPEEVAPKTLYKAIEDYLPDEKLVKSADVTRILGNDTTHYIRKYPQLDLKTLKRYLGYFIDIVAKEIELANPPVFR